MEKKQKLFMDCGSSLEHAVALWQALQAPHVELVGVGCSGADLGIVRQLLERERPGGKIPVAAGGSHVLLGQRAHGQDAARLLVEKAEEWDGELTVITLGPLTSLAKAAAIDPRLPSRLNRVVVKGGAIRAAGDVTAVAESNLYADPEAAAFVWAAGFPLLLVPLDATLQFLPTPEERRAVSEAARALGVASAEEISRLQDELRLDAWAAMMAALYPACVHTEPMKLTIECHSPLSRGAVLADLRARPSVGIDTAVAVAVDVEPYRGWLRKLSLSCEEGSR